MANIFDRTTVVTLATLQQLHELYVTGQFTVENVNSILSPAQQMQLLYWGAYHKQHHKLQQVKNAADKKLGKMMRAAGLTIEQVRTLAAAGNDDDDNS